jgi:SAM-dependent methyltransferase
MEHDEYRKMYEFEPRYWWYRGLRKYLLSLIEPLDLAPGKQVLDAGCGTGLNAATIRDATGADVAAFDVSVAASTYWRERGLTRAFVGSINEIPVRGGSFDACLSIDVLESDAVDEERAVAELARIVRPGAYILILVPAYGWLYNERHHRAVRATRRYTKKSLDALLSRQGLRPVRITYLFPTLLPVVAVYRWLQRFQSPKETVAGSDLRPLPSWINAILFGIVWLEARIVRRVTFPFGSSVVGVAQAP